jgi:hypothetical protein
MKKATTTRITGQGGATHLLGGSRLEEEFERFAQIFARLFDRRALARNVEFRAERYVPVGVALDDCR